MDTRTEKINELIKNEAFAEEIKDVETAEGLQAAFKAHGVELTLAEVEAICIRIAVETGNVEELSENDLEDVAGGFAVTSILVGLACIGVCYGVGWVAGRVIRNKSGVCR